MWSWAPYLQDDNEEEIDVGNVVKLKPQVLRYEAQWSVLRRSNLVSSELLLVVAIFCLHFFW